MRKIHDTPGPLTLRTLDRLGLDCKRLISASDFPLYGLPGLHTGEPFSTFIAVEFEAIDLE